MSEYKLHHLVGELIDLLGSTSAPEKHVEKLQKESAISNSLPVSSIATQSCVRQLAKNSPNPELFIQKYEELKSKKLDLLGPFMQLLEFISIDKELKKYLAKPSTTSIESSLTTVKITSEDVPKIFKNVKKAVAEGEKKMIKQVIPSSKLNDGIQMKRTWSVERPRISWDFQSDNSTGPNEKVVPTVSQESILLWDILNCLKGIDGSYIVAEPLETPYSVRLFKISSDVDISLKQLSQRILPLASYYSMTIRFVEEKILPEDGQVNHALRGALSCLLKDYLLFVVQLEKDHIRGKLNLQNLWFYIQPTMSTMIVLNNITSTIFKANARGGKVLSILYEQLNSMSIDVKCKELCLFLIKAASVPYMQILEKWVYKGVICDPYHEFFVEDNELIQREELPIDYSADYWEKRYTMRPERIPAFLNEHAQTIIKTGKYFNVIRQCGKTVQWGKQEPLVYQYRDQKFISALDRAYSEAARILLEVLIQENDLMGRLKSVKNYFLLAQGDFVVQFMNLCEPELSKNMFDIVLHRLASLLEVALRTSTADSDPYKDDLKPELLPYDLQYQMFRILSIQTNEEKDYFLQTDKVLIGIEAFVFNYDVKWPVSLVINRKAIACYQMLFRHIFYCKHIERKLCRVWISNKIAKTFSHQTAMSYRQAFSLRHRMLDCIQHLEYYMMVEVIEPNWLTFLNKMSKVTNIDDVLSVHQDLQDSYLKECMLTDPELLACITGICTTCIEFCKFMQSECGASSSTLNNTISEETMSFEQKIQNIDTKFTDAIIRLLNRICDLGCDNSNEKLLNVVSRLDFNLFYTKILKEQAEKKNKEEKSV